MGVSTDGQLAYGIPFKDGAKFPWDDDLEGWWREVNGFKSTVEDPYDSKGNYKPGKTREDATPYFKEMSDWEKKHPVPVELVNYCSGDYPMYMLAVPGSMRSNSRGPAIRIFPANLVTKPSSHEIAKFNEFVNKYLKDLPTEGEQGWYLTSYWG